MPTGTLEILLHGARDLYDTTSLGKMDPYAKIRIGDHVLKSRTHQNGGRSPHWNQTFTANVLEGHRQILVELYDEDDFTADDKIGTATVDLDRAFSGIVEDSWFQVLRHGHFAGQIQFRLTFRPLASAQHYPTSAPPSYSAPSGYPGQAVYAPQQPVMMAQPIYAQAPPPGPAY
ncbi:C2 domain-containing protein [Blastocladiella britannica]|nr:C2 domain-containing protein [Blastocladiella britannica]